MINNLTVWYKEQETFESIQDAKINPWKIAKAKQWIIDLVGCIIFFNGSLSFPTYHHSLILPVFASMLFDIWCTFWHMRFMVLQSSSEVTEADEKAGSDRLTTNLSGCLWWAAVDELPVAALELSGCRSNLQTTGAMRSLSFLSSRCAWRAIPDTLAWTQNLCC
jgi:hypothetical protein